MTLDSVIQKNWDRFIRAREAANLTEVTKIFWVKRLLSTKMIIEKSQERIWELENNFGLTESGKIVTMVTDTHRMTDEYGQLMRDNAGNVITGWVVRDPDQLSSYEERLLTMVIESWASD